MAKNPSKKVTFELYGFVHKLTDLFLSKKDYPGIRPLW